MVLSDERLLEMEASGPDRVGSDTEWEAVCYALRSARARVAELEQENQELREEDARLQARCAQWEKDWGEAFDRQQAAEKRVAELEGLLSECRAEMGRLQRRYEGEVLPTLERLKSSLEHEHRRAKEATDAAAYAHEQLEQARDEIRRLTEALAESERRRAELGKAFADTCSL